MKCRIFVLLLLIGVAENVMSYTPGEILLKKCRSGETVPEEIKWGQSVNSEFGCSPSYNYHISDYAAEGEDCYRLVAGCAAIAFGQIMAMWQYPLTSKYRTYNWENIPPYLKDGDSEDCPLLIKDVGRACGTHYTVAGFNIDASWTPRHDFRDGIEEMGYYVETCTEKDWLKYNTLDGWYDFIRSEIDCGRPVIMFGEDRTIFKSHYFVIDGYSEYDPYRFHINYGHNNGGSFIDIRTYRYNEDREIFYGIYPKREDAPKINYKKMRNYIFSNCKYSKAGRVQYSVENADSWECSVFDRDGILLWKGGGTVKEGIADVWDGSSSVKLSQDDYWLNVTFKNSNGARATVIDHFAYVTTLNNSYRVEGIESQLLNSRYTPNNYNGENKVIEIKTDNVSSYVASFYDLNGFLVWTGSGNVAKDLIKLTTDLSNYESGYYSLELKLDGGCHCSSSTTESFRINYDKSVYGELTEATVIDSCDVISIINAPSLLEIRSAEKMNRISVYSTSGICVAQEICLEYDYSFDISNWSKNMLIIVVETENGIYSQKVVIE